MTDTLWMCEQLRAGQVYNKVSFNTKKEAEDFIAKMQKMEPDLFWRIEPIAAKMVWN
jgi:hypothetical protein